LSVPLTLLECWMPAALRRRALDDLTAAVAGPFGCAPPHWTGLPFEARLDGFARWTAAQAAAVETSGRAAEVETGLYAAAERLGGSLRRRLGVRGHREALRALVLLYRQIGIDFRPRGGAVEIPRCAFGAVYTPAVCGLMSAVDRGLVAGLTSGWRLDFSERLTEGAPACLATLLPPPAPPRRPGGSGGGDVRDAQAEAPR
jgi:hypothetical protein